MAIASPVSGESGRIPPGPTHRLSIFLRTQGKAHVESGLWIKGQGLGCGEQADHNLPTPHHHPYPCSITPLDNYSRCYVALKGGDPSGADGADGSDQASGSWPSALGCEGNTLRAQVEVPPLSFNLLSMHRRHQDVLQILGSP